MEFDKKITNAIKGIALIFMFIHHFFMCEHLLVDEITETQRIVATIFTDPFKSCVGLYAFLTGYFLAKLPGLNYKKISKKIVNVLIPYQMVFLLLLLVAVLVGSYNVNGTDFLLELYGLKRSVMVFCWYVPFYICSLVIMSILIRLCKDNLFFWMLLGIIACTMLFHVAMNKADGTILYGVLSNLRDNFLVIPVGYIYGKWNVFGRLEKNRWCQKAFLMLLLFVMAFMGRFFMRIVNLQITTRLGSTSVPFSMDILYIPFLCYCFIKFLKRIENMVFMRVLEDIGANSMLMWFLSCAFFNISKKTTQIVLFWPRNPILVLIWGLVLCRVVAWPINLISTKIRALIMNSVNICWENFNEKKCN